MVDSSILKNNVLITGGAGFIGSYLAEALLKKDCLVTVIDNLSTGNIKNIKPFLKNSNFRFVYENCENEIVMDRLVSECDVLYHLAAAVGVDLIVRDPVRVIETNIQGTHVVLKLANRYRKKVMIASTSEIYGKRNDVPFTEDSDRLLGATTRSRWCYSATKAIDEFLGLAYYKMYGLPLVIFRLFNTVGPRQSGQYGMVIPRFIDQALNGKKISVYGDGNQTRCFCNVSDVVRALIGLAESREAVGEIFNIGGTVEISILELAKKIAAITQASSPEDIIEFIPYKQAYEEGFEDMQRRVPDISKIISAINWKPEITLDETLKEIIEDKRKS